MKMGPDTVNIVRFLLDRGITAMKIYPFGASDHYLSNAALDEGMRWVREIRDNVGNRMDICYSKLLRQPGKRHPGARHYFDGGGVILSILAPTGGGAAPTPGPKSLYFAVGDLDAVHARAAALNALAQYEVHGEPAVG